MRYLTMISGPESAGPPPQGLVDAIAKLGAEATEAGVLVETGGLGPTALGARIQIGDTGTITVTDGPFTEVKEVIGGYAVFETKTKEEALAWCRRFAEVHAEHWPGYAGTVEMREVVFRQ